MVYFSLSSQLWYDVTFDFHLDAKWKTQKYTRGILAKNGKPKSIPGAFLAENEKPKSKPGAFLAENDTINGDTIFDSIV